MVEIDIDVAAPSLDHILDCHRLLRFGVGSNILAIVVAVAWMDTYLDLHRIDLELRMDCTYLVGRTFVRRAADSPDLDLDVAHRAFEQRTWHLDDSLGLEEAFHHVDPLKRNRAFVVVEGVVAVGPAVEALFVVHRKWSVVLNYDHRILLLERCQLGSRTYHFSREQLLCRFAVVYVSYCPRRGSRRAW